MKFDEISIWVQCYNLPMILMHKDLLQKIGSHVGAVEVIDTRENGFCIGRYVRIRVRIDVTKPLKQFVRVSTNPVDEDVCVILSYE